MWAILLSLEPFTWELLAISCLVSGGVSLASYGEASFSWMGFGLVTAACCLSGLRWALTQTMLQTSHTEGGALQPLEVLYHISPASALSCIPVFLLIELRPFLASPFLQAPGVLAEALLIVLGGGLISFLLIFAEVKLVKISSSLTMGIFGNLKEVVTIALSMAVFQDRVSLLNSLGLVLSIGGALWYRRYKLREKASSSAEYIPADSWDGMWHLEEDEEAENQRL